MINPREFATVAASMIKGHLTDELVNGIQYERIDDWYEMTRFEENIDSWQERLVPAEHSIYDRIVCDSEVERRFVEGLENNDCVLCYVKLPNWFTVSTPVGEYNPDWALVWQDRDPHGSPDGKPVLYLVRETKSTHDHNALRPDESRKIRCGMRHFRDVLGVDYDIATSAADIHTPS